MQYLTWDDVEKDCEALAVLVKDTSFQAILGVARGGVVPALLVAKILDIAFYDVIGLSSYEGQKQTGTINLIKNPSMDLQTKCPDGEGLLIIDDLVDTGDTLSFLRLHYPKAIYAVPYAKPKGRDCADYVVKSFAQEEWLVFPWEKHE